MTKRFHVLTGVDVTNTILADAAATLSGNVITNPDLTTITAPPGATFFDQANAGVGWKLAGGVLIPLTPPPPPVATKADLIAFAGTYQGSLMMSGRNVTVSGTTHLFPTDTDSMTAMNTKVTRLNLLSPPTAMNWELPAGFSTLSAADFLLVFANISDWIQATFDAQKIVVASINANSITTTAGVAAASDWPVN